MRGSLQNSSWSRDPRRFLTQFLIGTQGRHQTTGTQYIATRATGSFGEVLVRRGGVKGLTAGPAVSAISTAEVSSAGPGVCGNMRLSVLDVGSNAVNMVVADTNVGHRGDLPMVAHSWKRRTFLAETVRRDGTITAEGLGRVVAAVAAAAKEVSRADVDQLFAYATAAVRDAPNRAEVLDAVESATGIRLGMLSGVEEAKLTFLAAR
ncbi:hypothetical protein AB0F10_42535, partial [Actinoplanes sp. NPDC026623]